MELNITVHLRAKGKICAGSRRLFPRNRRPTATNTTTLCSNYRLTCCTTPEQKLAQTMQMGKTLSCTYSILALNCSKVIGMKNQAIRRKKREQKSLNENFEAYAPARTRLGCLVACICRWCERHRARCIGCQKAAI